MLVNYRFIARIRAREGGVTTGTVLPLARRKAAEIKQQYLKLLSRVGSVLL